MEKKKRAPGRVPEHPITDSDRNRQYKFCKCAKCGIVEKCTPSFDFYETKEFPGELVCEDCVRDRRPGLYCETCVRPLKIGGEHHKKNPEWAEDQPEWGDVLLHCGHEDLEHWFKVPRMKFGRPDGTTGYAKWIVCCDKCFNRADGDPLSVQIRGDGKWHGKDPVIRASQKNPNVRSARWK